MLSHGAANDAEGMGLGLGSITDASLGLPSRAFRHLDSRLEFRLSPCHRAPYRTLPAVAGRSRRTGNVQ